MENVTTTDKIPWKVLLVGVVVYLLVHVLLTGQAHIGGSSEAREAHIISVIYDQGEWVLPLRNGIIPSKPPLFHWIGAGLSHTLGAVSEFSARLPSVLSGLVTLICVGLSAFRLGQVLEGRSGLVRPSHVCLLACAILSLCYGFHQMSTQAMVDMVFTSCMWAALTSLLWCDRDLWIAERRVSSGSIALFWGFCALGVLARGPLGIVLPLVVAGTAGLVTAGIWRTAQNFLRPSSGWLFFLVPVAWYYMAYERGGTPFLDRQLFFENVKRLTGGEHINTEAWWFYLPSLVRTTLPWGVLAIVFGVREAVRGRRVTGSSAARLVVVGPLLCLAAGVLLLSVASGKRHSYLLPLMPVVAIEAALVFSLIRARKESVWVGRAALFAARAKYSAQVFVGMLLVAAIVFVEGHWDAGPLTATAQETLSALLLPTAGTLGLALVCGYLLPRFSAVRIGFESWCALFIAVSVSVSAGLTLKAGFKGFRAMATELTSLPNVSSSLVVIKDPFDEYFDPIMYYLRRPVRVQRAEPHHFICNENETYVTHARWLQEIGGAFQNQVVVLGTIMEHRDRVLGENRRQVVVFRCRLTESPGVGSSGLQTTGLFDASHSSSLRYEAVLREL